MTPVDMKHLDSFPQSMQLVVERETGKGEEKRRGVARVRKREEGRKQANLTMKKRQSREKDASHKVYD